MPTISSVAHDAASYMERVKRDDDTYYVRATDDAPAWLKDAIYAAHGDRLPNDWVYDLISDAIDWIADNGHDTADDARDAAHNFADGVDVYTHDLLGWYAIPANRGYCEDAADTFGESDDMSIDAQIMRGQYMQREEILQSVISSLEDRADDLEAGDLDDDDTAAA